MPARKEGITSVVDLKQALLMLDQSANCEQLWAKVRHAANFYVTYSNHKPGLGDADQICEILLLSATDSIRQTDLAAQYGIRVGEIYNGWQIMHSILTIALTPEELQRLGLLPASLNINGEHVLELQQTYRHIIPNLQSTEAIQPMLRRNPHFHLLMRHLADGNGIRGFLRDFVGPNHEYYFDPRSIYYIEGAFRRGLTIGLAADASDEDSADAGYNYVFLRKALLTRYSERSEGITEATEISPSYVIDCMQRMLSGEPADDQNVSYLGQVKNFINNLPYYESKMTGDSEYRTYVGRLSIGDYLELHREHNTVPYPLNWVIGRTILHETQEKTAAQMRKLGIGYSVQGLRAELSCVGRMMENILLTPKLFSYGDELFMKVMCQAHKQDIATLTAAAAGRLGEFES